MPVLSVACLVFDLVCSLVRPVRRGALRRQVPPAGRIAAHAERYRTASGAPATLLAAARRLLIRATLDEERRAITASEQITYHNRSPDSLAYLWLQLDQNGLRQDADQRRVLSAPSRQAWLSGSEDEALKFEDFRAIHAGREFDGGFKLTAVKAANGKPLPYVVNQTMLRIDLPVALAPGQSVTFNIDWSYRINDQKVLVERSGYEYFEDDKNTIFQIAQWFPRMAAYYDAVGWQHKQFLGSGEFTLEFGDYELYLTVPAITWWPPRASCKILRPY